MSLRHFGYGFVLSLALLLTAVGCSSPPWRNQQSVSQHENHSWMERSAERIEYDDSSEQSHEYRPQVAAESVYPPAGRRQAATPASCH